MKRMMSFGEALIDMQPLSPTTFEACPGGAPANVAVAFSRLGGAAAFAGGLASDAMGQLLEQSFTANGVDTSPCFRDVTASTALVLISHDGSGDRSFQFYRHDTADLRFPASHWQLSHFQGDSWFHFCSNTLNTPSLAAATDQALSLAKRQGCRISFDVNLRPGLWPTEAAMAAAVTARISEADLVKFSADELALLARCQGETIAAYRQRCLAGRCQLLVVTDGAAAVSFFTQDHQGEVIVPAISAVDTTAAGDAFVGALLWALADKALNEAPDIERAVAFAVQAGSFTCLKKGAFSALPRLSDLQVSRETN